MTAHLVLINGAWRPSTGTTTFQASNPAAKESLADVFPVSPWEEAEAAIHAASDAFRLIRTWPGERFALFLETYAAGIEARAAQLVESAHLETALAVAPRLKDVELPRTVNQLRQAAAAAREGSWTMPTIDTKANIRSLYHPIGPVVVFGPNNFPFAFNSASGGDFAAAIAAGNPVIAKAHTSHPNTTRIFAEEAFTAAQRTKLPPGFVQLIYRTSHQDGKKLVSHPEIGAAAYTGSRAAGLDLKQAADAAGKPIYLELSSVNPVFILPGALEERLEALVDEFTASCLMGAGQFCTNPGLVVLVAGEKTEAFINAVATRFNKAPVGTLLGPGVESNFAKSVAALKQAGAKLVAGGEPGGGAGYSFRNTLLRATGDQFLTDAERLQTEAFGNESLFVVARNLEQLAQVADHLEGNLTGSVYTATSGADDAAYERLELALRQKVGRLLNDKMPTGVAVSPAMNHGGPFPATGHPGFTSVGIPASLKRFAMLACYDNVRPQRLPPLLADKNPGNLAWRTIDGQVTRFDVGSG